MLEDRLRRAFALGDPLREGESSDTGPEQTVRIFGEAKLARLGALKQAWDPDNVFHVNPNVAPTRS